MSKSELAFFDGILLGPVAILINQYLGAIVSERIVLWVCLVCTFFLSSSKALIYVLVYGVFFYVYVC